MEIHDIVKRLRELEITSKHLSRAQDSLQREREELLGELEEQDKLREAQGGGVSPTAAETSNRIVNPYALGTHTPIPVVNPYARPLSTLSSNNPEAVASSTPNASRSASTPNAGRNASTPNTSHNASGRIVRLSGASKQTFNIGDRVEIINDLYRTLRHTTDIKDYQGTVIDISPCTVLIMTDSAVMIRKHFKSIIKIE